MTEPQYKHAGHLRYLLPTDELKKTVEMSIKVLQGYDFDSIAFRGMSGALIAPILAVRMDKSLIMVRKDTEDTHSHYFVEGNEASERYVIVDDFVSGGDTFETILEEVREFAPKAGCIGILETTGFYETLLNHHPLIERHTGELTQIKWAEL